MAQFILSADHWRRCNGCKKAIPYSVRYWVCNVSTCNRKTTGFVFCNVSCWDAHLPMMNHREAWAEERTSPTHDEWAKEIAGENKPVRKRNTHSESKPIAYAPINPSGAPKTILRRPKGSE